MRIPRWLKVAGRVALVVVALVIIITASYSTGRLSVTVKGTSPVAADLSFYDGSSIGHWVKNPVCPSGTAAIDVDAGGLDNDRSTIAVDPNFDRYGVGENPVVRSTNSSLIVAVIPMKYIPEEISGVTGDYWGFWRYEAPGVTSQLLLEHARVSGDQTLRVCIR